MILADSGFIIATILASDKNHGRALTSVGMIRTSAITTWPCITEAMYLLLTQSGNQAQEKLRTQIQNRLYRLPEPTEQDADRACALMRQYIDTPMDFADASLVVAAERLNITTILTFDRHFYAYRIHGRTPFEVIPG